MPDTRRTCQHWITLNSGRTGACEHPYIRNEVICNSAPYYEHPDPEWAKSVGYRTAPDFKCIVFKPLTLEERLTFV